ncbi:twin-arginine translocase TatA/TatE family subunit [Herbiconiux moechotypicola]|uniref:Sec-independent protein translocase TatB n=1 Tax=Herbiconiux moechotypicola TaxID=637393 RepID=A0ABN3E2C6_9MICO|nr:twin-arginine translocase TatA/TatE family subunit [Herbiconiux moechotypicola]MCS5731365.1 twin-arginine translocase TatA/TatE family subunit [Herbiconiux moechotypicola]
MFGLTFEKLLLIGVIAAFIIGPQRLPLYAEKLGSFVRAVRGFTETAKSRVAEELGPDFDAEDWKKLDPRQYDPRRIVRDALAPEESAGEGSPEREPSASFDAPSSAPRVTPVAASAPPKPAKPIAPGGWQEAMLARVGPSSRGAA